LATRLVADERNVTYRPSELMEGSLLAPPAWAPVEETLTR